MQRDFKIGLIVGLIFVVVAGLWLATRPSLSPEARMQRLSEGNTDLQLSDEPQPFASDVREAARNQLSPRTEGQMSGPGLPGGTTSHVSDSTIAVRHPPADYEKPEKIRTERFYIVREGDNLSAISQLHYGTPNKWQVIFNANRRVIRDPDEIQPGMRLIIP
jgi:nucleoid-associated protein YgaU